MKIKNLIWAAVLCMLLLSMAVSCMTVTPPQIPAVRSLTVGVGAQIPEAEVFFTAPLPSGVRAVYAEEYSFTHTGKYRIAIDLLDANGKRIERVETDFSLVTDNEPPVMQGVGDISICIGDGISYRSGVTLSDNCYGEVRLQIDSSAVDSSTEGVYPVTYVATDAVGNRTEKQVFVYVYRESVSEEMLYALLDPIIADHIPRGAGVEQQVRAVYDYVYYSISYDPYSDKSDWVRAAYEGLRSGEGDCYTYFALSKAFFERLGIENIDIRRTEGIVDERHYWSMVNLGSESAPRWYHFDATRLSGIQHSGCLLTDLQVQAYTKQRTDENGVGNYFYVYDVTKYPASDNRIITSTPSLEPYY